MTNNANPALKKITGFLVLAVVLIFGGWVYWVSTSADVAEASADVATMMPPIPEGIEPVLLELELKSGTVVLELRPDLAPGHVARIVELANQGFYDGLLFHRVIEGFMAQTGDPQGTGMGGSDLPDLAAEFNAAPFIRGTIGMARAASPNSANSQFFINLDDAQFLNGQYTLFGYVKSGMEFVDQIKLGSRADNGAVTDPDAIVSLRAIGQ
ncbi:MAG: peptidylprolyl isomerase [Alphaproteobacteria bacterium]|nr:peptidylprolyl isomerase [Alphaproteobacteria bacterium]